jgi:F-box-like
MDSSPFSSRLDSNYVASDSESLEIQSLLELPTSRLEELTNRLQELEEQSTQIRNEQSALRIFISKHRALISLIRKLPIDILQEIFIACLPIAHNNVMSRWEPPILLTQVCSSWRNVAHATPQLWKSIHIAVPYNKLGRYSSEHPYFSSSTVEHDRRSEAVVEWLTRSTTYPLDISLGHLESNAVDGFYHKIIESLIRFSERWRQVRLSAPYQALVPIASLPPSKVPLLETLSLNCSPAHTGALLDFQSVWMTSGVLKAPNLRDFGLWLAHLHEDITRLPINWSQLTNISIEGSSWGTSCPLSISRAYKLLSVCRNLITCRLEIGHTEFNELPLQTTTTLIPLPFLTRLSVREVNASLSRLFSLLHLPSLNYIEFHTAIWPTQQSSTSLLSLLTRFHTTIQLITDAESFTRQDFIQCLRLCPLLKSLYIRKSYGLEPPPGSPSCIVDDAFLKLFFEPSNEGYLCPHLEDFESSSETAFSETTLLQFVKEKNGDSNTTTTTTGLAKLKLLFVVFYGPPLGDIKQELEPYEQAGLVTSLTYPLRAPFSAFGGLPGYSPPY